MTPKGKGLQKDRDLGTTGSKEGLSPIAWFELFVNCSFLELCYFLEDPNESIHLEKVHLNYSVKEETETKASDEEEETEEKKSCIHEPLTSIL